MNLDRFIQQLTILRNMNFIVRAQKVRLEKPFGLPDLITPYQLYII
jgi:hypothetical protein